MFNINFLIFNHSFILRQTKIDRSETNVLHDTTGLGREISIVIIVVAIVMEFVVLFISADKAVLYG